VLTRRPVGAALVVAALFLLGTGLLAVDRLRDPVTWVVAVALGAAVGAVAWRRGRSTRRPAEETPT
jgi:hypothetical protein